MREGLTALSLLSASLINYRHLNHQRSSRLTQSLDTPIAKFLILLLLLEHDSRDTTVYLLRNEIRFL